MSEFDVSLLASSVPDPEAMRRILGQDQWTWDLYHTDPSEPVLIAPVMCCPILPLLRVMSVDPDKKRLTLAFLKRFLADERTGTPVEYFQTIMQEHPLAFRLRVRDDEKTAVHCVVGLTETTPATSDVAEQLQALGIPLEHVDVISYDYVDSRIETYDVDFFTPIPMAEDKERQEKFDPMWLTFNMTFFHVQNLASDDPTIAQARARQIRIQEDADKRKRIAKDKAQRERKAKDQRRAAEKKARKSRVKNRRRK